jgi:hypothetical protein
MQAAVELFGEAGVDLTMNLDAPLAAEPFGGDFHPVMGLAFGPVTYMPLVKMGLVDYLKRDGPKSLG